MVVDVFVVFQWVEVTDVIKRFIVYTIVIFCLLKNYLVKVESFYSVSSVQVAIF